MVKGQASKIKRMKEAIEEDKELKLLRENLSALKAGENLFSQFSLPELRLSPARDDSAKLILHGNDAMVRGAIYAECQAFFGYPITPAAEIMQKMQEELSRRKGTFIQAKSYLAVSCLSNRGRGV